MQGHLMLRGHDAVVRRALVPSLGAIMCPNACATRRTSARGQRVRAFFCCSRFAVIIKRVGKGGGKPRGAKIRSRTLITALGMSRAMNAVSSNPRLIGRVRKYKRCVCVYV